MRINLFFKLHFVQFQLAAAYCSYLNSVIVVKKTIFQYHKMTRFIFYTVLTVTLVNPCDCLHSGLMKLENCGRRERKKRVSEKRNGELGSRTLGDGRSLHCFLFSQAHTYTQHTNTQPFYFLLHRGD